MLLNSRSESRRLAASFLELQVAMVVFCIALTGLCPLVIMQSKQLAKMQTWMQPQTTNYLVPASNTWARKLGATATLQSTLPGPSGAGPAGTVVNAVSIISLTRNLNSQQVSVQVSVQALVTP